MAAPAATGLQPLLRFARRQGRDPLLQCRVEFVAAEVGDRHHDQPGVALAHRLLPHTEFRQAPGGLGLKKDIRTVGQFQQLLAPLDGAHVGHGAALVGVRGREPQTPALMLRLRPTRRGALRRFHQHHVGAQVSQEPACETRSTVGEVDDAYAAKGK
jgi:hypothetical protein